MRKMKIFMMALLVILACSIAKPKQTEAAAGYKQLFQKVEAGEKAKSGAYEFCITKSSNAWDVMIRKEKSENFKKTPISVNAFVNGKDAYYIKKIGDSRKAFLYKYVFATEKESKVIALPTKSKYSGEPWYSGASWQDERSYGNYIYVTRIISDGVGFDTYATCEYDTKKDAVKLMDDICIITTKGAYAVGSKALNTNGGVHPYTLYKFTKSGLKKIRTLGKYGANAVFIGNKLFYVDCSDSSKQEAMLYRCREDGSGKKKLGTFKAPDGQARIWDITEKSCMVGIEKFGSTSNSYEYTYATKKMKKVS